MNALKTGIHAKSLVLPTENLADLQQLIDEYYQSHRPASPEARLLLDDIIRCEWTLRRLGVAETQLFEYAHQEAYTVEDDFPLGQSCMDNHKAFGQLQWRIDSTRRALYRALHTLQQLEAAPSPAPPVPDPPPLPPSPQTTSPQTGFLPSPRPLPRPPPPPQQLEAPPPPAPPVPDPPSLPLSPQTTSPQIGFVPSTPIPTPDPPGCLTVLGKAGRKCVANPGLTPISGAVCRNLAVCPRVDRKSTRLNSSHLGI